jgi:hypothetical protein
VALMKKKTAPTSETEKDMANVEAWAKIVSDVLCLMPAEHRLSTLHLALENEEDAAKEREENGGLVFIKASDFLKDKSWMKHWHAEMRLRSLIVQVFVRRVTSNHAPKDAAAILFARHRYGHGSGSLSDYIDDLPR